MKVHLNMIHDSFNTHRGHELILQEYGSSIVIKASGGGRDGDVREIHVDKKDLVRALKILTEE
jgi:hypothetical protein